MPLVANSGLPGFQRLKDEGEEVLESGRAATQNIRELHVGLLNMMPDAALEVTERQFMRLVGSCNRIAQFYIYPFTFPEIPRGDAAKAHIENYYFDVDDLKKQGLDALIITGAIPQNELNEEPFWEPLSEVLDWAAENVTSTLCACLATHATMKYFWDLDRTQLSDKQWGVYPHRRTSDHPITRNINSRFDVPHSRFNEISRHAMEQKDIKVLIDSDEAGVHLATSPDGFRFVFFQGHPEYDQNSLLKEYKREVNRFVNGERPDYPPYPANYFNDRGRALLDQYQELLLAAEDPQQVLQSFPEGEALCGTEYTWGDTAKIVFSNWLGLVYQTTGVSRFSPFMLGVDSADPLGLGQTESASDD
ncbi:MAG: homoserine O-succinyltransferase [Parasphingorhabdus sp.]|jgi:homoserine O-succinyltransferase